MNIKYHDEFHKKKLLTKRTLQNFISTQFSWVYISIKSVFFLCMIGERQRKTYMSTAAKAPINGELPQQACDRMYISMMS